MSWSMGDFDYWIYIIDKGYLKGAVIIGYFKHANINHTAYDYV